jgi:hypothetical protein
MTTLVEHVNGTAPAVSPSSGTAAPAPAALAVSAPNVVRIVDSQHADDFAGFAVSGPPRIVLVDEVAELLGRVAARREDGGLAAVITDAMRADALRAEIHLGLDDTTLTALAITAGHACSRCTCSLGDCVPGGCGHGCCCSTSARASAGLFDLLDNLDIVPEGDAR